MFDIVRICVICIIDGKLKISVNISKIRFDQSELIDLL